MSWSYARVSSRPAECRRCGGTGRCTQCDGKGRFNSGFAKFSLTVVTVITSGLAAPLFFMGLDECEKCGKTGNCSACGGTGYA